MAAEIFAKNTVLLLAIPTCLSRFLAQVTSSSIILFYVLWSRDFLNIYAE
ncbi:hypothetical protein CLOSTMETH_02370 [[Clostridium] methylpentosum DSM 5476]|uniref:Uncharacterized protein n=1 Tax=[Clostridium] methylpentosum DSM 5476 TaxID=537013 RepID=C0EET1_9FIRM|nr:hypothetical protein CLOSTMETH_02370 [[Clostridium] methylpentosum DSM 5476]